MIGSAPTWRWRHRWTRNYRRNRAGEPANQEAGEASTSHEPILVQLSPDLTLTARHTDHRRRRAASSSLAAKWTLLGGNGEGA